MSIGAPMLAMYLDRWNKHAINSGEDQCATNW